MLRTRIYTVLCHIYLTPSIQELEENVQTTQSEEEGQTVQTVPGECDGEEGEEWG